MINLADKPIDVKEYIEWYNKKFDCKINDYYEYYEHATLKLKKNLLGVGFIEKMNIQLRDWQDRYFIDSNGFNLFYSSFDLELVIKPFNSVIDKSFRKNILLNKNFPNEPTNGWITHENWFERINDIIRGVIVVKYIDGVDFVVSKLKEFSDDNSYGLRTFFEARDEGYYASHCYLTISQSVIKHNWTKKDIDLQVEIQITTQLQEVIRKLLHQYYEETRCCKKMKNCHGNGIIETSNFQQITWAISFTMWRE